MTFFEDVKIKRGETLAGLASDYGYNTFDWQKIWQHPRNKSLVLKRGNPKKIVEGDVIQIPIEWKITQKTIAANITNR